MHATPHDPGHDLAGLTSHVRWLLDTHLGPEVHYHDVAHTFRDVVPAAERLAVAENLPLEERRLVHAAALLHDTGYTQRSHGHERASVEIAADILPGFGFDAFEIDTVVRLILATRLVHEPQCPAEAIMKDADLDVLGRVDFWAKNVQLRRELHDAGERYEDVAWWRGQKRFLSRHRYLTTSAERARGPGKQANLRRVEAHLERLTAERPVRKRA